MSFTRRKIKSYMIRFVKRAVSFLNIRLVHLRLGHIFRQETESFPACLSERLGSGELTAFERLCDDAVMGYLAQARRIPFGEQAVVGYLYAREAEFTAIRTILSGRMAGLDADTIRERLREAYV